MGKHKKLSAHSLQGYCDSCGSWSDNLVVVEWYGVKEKHCKKCEG